MDLYILFIGNLIAFTVGYLFGKREAYRVPPLSKTKADTARPKSWFDLYNESENKVLGIDPINKKEHD